MTSLDKAHLLIFMILSSLIAFFFGLMSDAMLYFMFNYFMFNYYVHAPAFSIVCSFVSVAIVFVHFYPKIV